MSNTVILKPQARYRIEDQVTRIFERAYRNSDREETRRTISGTRRILKAVPLAGPVARSRYMGRQRPFMFHHYLTMKCNCSCESCLWKDNRAPQMTLPEIKNFYRQAAEAGFVGALLGGGEPLLRKDAPEIFRHAKKECGFRVATGTNGWFLEDRIDEVGDCIDAMLVSIDSADPATHDEIRGVPGLFDRVVRGIEKVKKEYPFIHLIVNTCIDNNSSDNIDTIIELVKDLDVPLSVDVITVGKNDVEKGRTADKQHMISSYEKMAEALHKVLEAKRRGVRVFNSEYYLTHFDNGKQPYSCRYPRMFLRVLANGDVEDCLRVGDPISNVTQKRLEAILESRRMKQLIGQSESCWLCSSPTMIDYSRYWESPTDMLLKDSPLKGGRMKVF